MKKLSTAVLMILILLPLVAIPSRLAVLDAPAVMTRENADLLFAVKSLAARGIEIYHYDRSHIVAGVPTAQIPSIQSSSRVMLNLPLNAHLYVIGNTSSLPLDNVDLPGSLLYSSDDSALLISTSDDVTLRAALRNPFTRLDLQPMRLPDDGFKFSAERAQRTDINQMLGLINQTSVQGMIQGLQDFETRYALAPNRLQVAQWIQQKFVSFGMQDVQLYPFQWNGTTQYNVVATIPGTVYPDQYIVVGGHHDSTNNSGDPYVSAPGADDNASGTVAALEMARVMMQSGYQPRTSIRFITFAAEEFGLWGAKNYAAYAQNNNMNIRLMMNHDMIANNNTPAPNWQVRLMPYDGSMNHSIYASQITEAYTSLGTFFGSLNSASSDSHPFWQRGYNVIYFFEAEFCPYYHSSNDIVANIDPVYATEVIKASAAVAATFADMPSAPFNLRVLDAGDGQGLVAQWDPVIDPLVTGYRLYYGTQLNNLGNPIYVTGTTYTVNGLLQGETYYFGVSAVDSFGNESYSIYSSGVPRLIPLTPGEFADQPTPNGVTLTWAANQEYDLSGYRLYRSTQSGVTGDLLTSIPASQNSYTDAAVTGGPHYYYYTLEAVDNTANASVPTQQLSSRPLTLNHGVLIVDETLNMSGTSPFQPNDEQADSFYDQLLSGYTRSQIDLESMSGALRLADIGIYSSILWHGNDYSDISYPYGVRDALEQYAAAGGNILFSIYSPTLAFDLNAAYPVTFPASSYLNNVLGIGFANYSNSARFRYAQPMLAGYPPLQVDSLKTVSSMNNHIFRVESITAGETGQNLYSYGSDHASSVPAGAMNGMPVAVLSQSRPGKIITLSFPLYNMRQADARALVHHVFGNVFSETSPVDDEHAIPAVGISIGDVYPNPFRSTASFRVISKESATPLKIGVYNLRGQLVRDVFHGMSAKSILHSWDGKDSAGRNVGSGIYMIRASQSGNTAIKRVIKIQ